MARRYGFVFMLMVLAVALPLRAQSGCDDSPEAPTVALAVVGGLGAVISRLRMKARR